MLVHLIFTIKYITIWQDKFARTNYLQKAPFTGL